jgi:hypothetical protein
MRIKKKAKMCYTGNKEERDIDRDVLGRQKLLNSENENLYDKIKDG